MLRIATWRIIQGRLEACNLYVSALPHELQYQAESVTSSGGIKQGRNNVVWTSAEGLSLNLFRFSQRFYTRRAPVKSDRSAARGRCRHFRDMS